MIYYRKKNVQSRGASLKETFLKLRIIQFVGPWNE